MIVKKILVVLGVASLVALTPAAEAGDRAVCKVWLDDGGVVARSTAVTPADAIGVRPDTVGLAYATLDGLACPAAKLQPDGGIFAWDAGLDLTLANGQPADGGMAGCAFCDFRGATSVAVQCRDTAGAGVKVYYSEKWDGGVDKWGQRGVMPATANDTLLDFTANMDPYRINLRGATTGQNQHLSVKPVSASASAYCIFETIKP